MKRFATLFIIGVLILSGIGVSGISNEKSNEIILVESIIFSEPNIKDNGQYSTIDLKEATTHYKEPGSPEIPIYTIEYTFPIGTKIKEVTCSSSNIIDKTLSKDIIPNSEPEPYKLQLNKNLNKKRVKNEEVYSSKKVFPNNRIDYRVGTGLEGNKHVTFLTVYYYPILYTPSKNIIHFTPNVQINIIYKPVQTKITFVEEFDLVVISPEEFTEEIQPLISHKDSHGIKSTIMSTEDIYQVYSGRDKPEQIKYFIKDAIETMGITYVILIGSMYKLPIRESHVAMWRWHQSHAVLSDLYYADVYDENLSFCSWDSNDNDKFGETGIDQVDLYADVHIGRIACNTNEELNVVIDKIIHYENETYGKNWFNKMIFIGGDTFPKIWGWPTGFEGEIHNRAVMDIMQDFEPSAVIWTSSRNFNRRTISKAINEGAGFIDYSGHGFEHGMGTYPPYGRALRAYLTPYIKDLENEYELPIIFFDACLTARLDFTFKDFFEHKIFRIFRLLTLLPDIDKDMALPCFAWCFVKHEGGGAIATIGATRTAFGGEDYGCEKLSIEFFNSYETSETLGQMMTKAQNAYINDLPDDEFTVEEFIILGDPSLRVGGYP